MARILIVDDEDDLRAGLGTYLELQGYDVDTAPSAEEAPLLNLTRYDLLLLDIMMGEMSGTDLAMNVRENPLTASVPIIFLTAKDNDDDMVAGLNLGADDYIAKPYSLKNVLARIEAVLRRVPPRPAASDGVTCDRNTLTCTADGVPLKLPRKEFEILAMLLENPGRIFTREELLAKIWPERTVVSDRTVDVHITRLRAKLGNYGKCITSRSGYGYGWQD